MKQIKIIDDLSVSKLIFGTDRLMNIWSRKERERLLALAMDHGVTHFDTAPLYGFGQSERSLRLVLRAYPNATVTSKVGLYPPGARSQSFAQVMIRKGLGRIFPPLKRPFVNYSPEMARLSVETTLRNLDRDRLDLLLIHDPDVSHLNCDAWYELFLDLKRKGMIRNFGIDGAVPRIAKFVEKFPDLCPVPQCRDDLRYSKHAFCQKLNCTPKITYGYMADSLVSRVALEPIEAFSKGITRFESGSVIGSSNSSTHLLELCRVVNEAKLS